MKTKTLLLAVALAGAGAVSGMAQTVYSVNAVGFVNVVIPQGPNSFTIISNPLDAADNSVAALFPSAPVGSAIFKFVGGAFVPNTRGFTAWSSPTMTLVPGEAFFFKNPSALPLTNTFVGEVKQGTLTTPLAAGFQLVASQVPQSGLVSTDLGLPISASEAVYRFQSGAYVTHNRGFTSWTPSEPTIQAGEGFFLKKNANPANWVRTFSVNQ
jgi:hypothetical protein